MREFDFGQPSDSAEDDNKYKRREKSMKAKVKIVSILLVMACGVGMATLIFHPDVWSRAAVSSQSFMSNSSKTILASALDVIVATTTDWLNIRSGPGTQYGVEAD